MDVSLGNAGYEVSIATVDVSSRTTVHALVDMATRLGMATSLRNERIPAIIEPHEKMSLKTTAKISVWSRESDPRH